MPSARGAAAEQNNRKSRTSTKARPLVFSHVDVAGTNQRSQYSRYYYRNDKTAETQWDYPQAMAGVTAAAGTEATTAVVDEEISVKQDEISAKNVVGVSSTISPLTTSATLTTTATTAAAVVTCAASLPPPITYAQTYPYYNYMMYPSCYNNGVATTTTTATPTVVSSSELPPPPPGEDPAMPPLPPSEADQVKPPPPPPASESADDDDEMEISDNESVASAPPLPPSRPIEVQAGPVDYASVPVRFPSAAQVSSATYYSNPISSVETESQQPLATETKTKKVKKAKKAIKKPPKQMSGLISKWREAQNALEEEKLRVLKEAEEEFEAEFDNEKRIAKWKKEQLKNGKAAQNANFEPVSQDWRKRVAAKRQQQGGL